MHGADGFGRGLAVGNQVYSISSSGWKRGGVHVTSSCQCSHIWMLILNDH